MLNTSPVSSIWTLVECWAPCPLLVAFWYMENTEHLLPSPLGALRPSPHPTHIPSQIVHFVYFCQMAQKYLTDVKVETKVVTTEVEAIQAQNKGNNITVDDQSFDYKKNNTECCNYRFLILNDNCQTDVSVEYTLFLCFLLFFLFFFLSLSLSLFSFL